jgi:nucleotide-binding universal stress UspA family protein
MNLGGENLYKKLLLPTDGSEYSEKAGEHAIWIADKSFAEIIVLNVVDTSYLRALPPLDLKKTLEDNLWEEGKNAINKFSEELEKDQCNGFCKNVKLTVEIKKGKPAEEILRIIEDENIDLVVIGASGKHAITKFLEGSVTERVVRSAKCSVLVVK